MSPTSTSEPTRVACVGDSITYGSGAAAGRSYPAQLQEMLGDQWKVGNFGIGGRTMLRKGDGPYWNEKAFADAQAFQPDIVILMLGTNDTKPQNIVHLDEFLGDYRDMVKVFEGLESKPSIYVCLPCPVPPPGLAGINEAGVQKEIPLIRQLAREMNLKVIDMHAALEGRPGLLPDHVHPSTEGAAELARAAYRALTGKSAPGVRHLR